MDVFINDDGRSGFYQKCAELLGTTYDYKPFPYAKRTRWNNRAPGNGRFGGFGLIRLFGSTVHMSLKAPVKVNRWFTSREDALAFLEGIATK